MINAPVNVVNQLQSDNVSYANIITINLGDALGSGEDYYLRITDTSGDVEIDGETFRYDECVEKIDGISRKLQTGSDQVDISFSMVDENIIDLIESKRYAFKPTKIERVIFDPVDGSIVDNFRIPIRYAWAISHSIDGDDEDRVITLTLDTALGALNTDNGWYALNSSHQQRYPNDEIMKWSSTVFSEEQQRVYSNNVNGVIDQNVKPLAMPVIYGYKNATPVPILQLQHRKTHSSYRHYFTTWIYVISAGSLNFVDTTNLRRDGEDVDMTHVTNTNFEYGGWSFRVLYPSENNTPIKTNTKLNFWKQRMDTSELNRLNGMFGKGLTLMFVVNRNRDNWIDSPPEFTIPVRGISCYDPRSGSSFFTRNPALQYADFIRNTTYGAGNLGITITDDNVIELANHYDNLPGSTGNPGINNIKMDVQLDTSDPIVDNMEIWTVGARMYVNDYYGVFKVKPETIESPVLTIHTDDGEDGQQYEFESGEVTERITRLTYKIKQLVPDTSEDAEVGDLVEVDVESTFPPLGSAIYNTWLDEDGGVENFESGDLDHVSELEQAFFWTMVDARISRDPSVLELPIGPISWLLEGGDVLRVMSDDPRRNDTLWRLEELQEDVESSASDLTLIPYDDNFYSPDPNAIPDPEGYASIKKDILGDITAFEILNDQDNYSLSFQPLVDVNLTHYAVEIEDLLNPGVLVYDEPKLTFPPFLMPNIGVGNYVARVTPVGDQIEGQTYTYNFTISNLVTPETIPSVVGVPGRIVVEPPTPQFENRTYEWRYYTSDNSSIVYWGDGRVLNLSPVVENVTYFIEYRLKSLVSQVAPGEWIDVSVDGVEQVLYTWIAYADDATGTNISLSPVDKAYYGIATGRTSPTFNISTVDVNLFKWIEQASGGGGEPAINATLSNESHGLPASSNGVIVSYNGASTTMKVFVGVVDDSAAWNFIATTGSGISGNLSGNTYTVTGLGIEASYVDITATRTGYADITKRFNVFKSRAGEEGQQGEPGLPGTTGPSGTTTYTWIKYSDNANGNPIVNSPTSNTKYIGFAYNQTTATESNDPSEYTWSLIRGNDGDTGVAGPPGPNGETLYTWIKYSAASSGAGLTDTPQSDSAYIGISINNTSASESSDPSDYTWSRFRGEDGPQGVQGPVGPTGITLYTWIRYSANADGSASTNEPESDSAYIGLAYNQTSPVESTDHTLYTWSEMGSQGVQGPKGEDGETLYTWIRYAESADGQLGNTNTPNANTQYIGIAVNRPVQTEDTNVNFYTWSRFRGEDGPQGVQGPKGDNGQSLYTWIRYSPNADGSGSTNNPQANSAYIGLAYNQTSPVESTDYTLYTWSEMGSQGVAGPKGDNGESLYTWIKYSAVSSGAGLTNTPQSDTEYIGIAHNKTTATESNTPSDYTWSKFKGDDGEQGPIGPPGIPGVDSPDAYSDSDASSGFTATTNWQDIVEVTVPSGLGTFTITAVGNISGYAEINNTGEPVETNSRVEVKIINKVTRSTITGSHKYFPSSTGWSKGNYGTYNYSNGGAGAATYLLQARIQKQLSSASVDFAWNMSLKSGRN